MIFLWIVVVVLVPFVFLAFAETKTVSRRVELVERRVAILETEFEQELTVSQPGRAAGRPVPSPNAGDVSLPPLPHAKISGAICHSCSAGRQVSRYCWSCGADRQETIVPPAPAAAGPPSPTAEAGASEALQPGASEKTAGVGGAAWVYPPPPLTYHKPRPSLLERAWTRFRQPKDWEALVGGRILNRIGAIALILGLGLLFKYAVDNNWISQPFRVGIGVAVGVGSLVLAARTNKRGLPIFAQGLVGAGIAILYLSVYASYNFYHLVPALAALAAMFVVTAIGFQQALRYDSLVVSLLSLFGGFLTPLVESHLHPNAYGLFTYVFLLAAGTLAIARKKPKWFVLEPLTLLGTYLSYLLWYDSSYQPSRWLSTVLLLTLLWSVFYMYDIYLLGRAGTDGSDASGDRTGAAQRRWREIRHGLAAINGIVYYIGLYTVVAQHHYSWVAPATGAVAAVYALTAVYGVRRSDVDAAAIARQALSAIVLAVLAPALAFHGFGITIAWTLEALALVGMGALWKRTFLWGPAIAVYVLAVLRLISLPETYRLHFIARFLPVFNDRALTMLLLTASLAISGVLLQHIDDARIPTIRQLLIYTSTAVFFLYLTVETNDLFRRLMAGATGSESARLSYDRFLAIGLVWMAYALPLIWFGPRKRISPLLWSGLASAAAAIGMTATVGASFRPISSFEPVLNVRFGLMALIIGALLIQYRWLATRADEHPTRSYLCHAIQVAVVAIGFELMTVEVNDFFRHRTLTHIVSGQASFVEFMILAGLWMVYSLPLTWAGIHRRATALLGCGILSAATAVIAGTSEGVAFQPRSSFAVVLGIRLGIFLLLIAGLDAELQWIRKRDDPREWLTPVISAFQAAVVILGFALISVETRDIFGYLIQPSLSAAIAKDAIHLHNLEQLALSLAWLAYAIGIIVVGIWRRIRWLRLGALVLFGFIILKIFAYDLGFLQAGLRSISFIVLGLILLGVSYLYQRYRSLLFEVTA